MNLKRIAALDVNPQLIVVAVAHPLGRMAFGKYSFRCIIQHEYIGQYKQYHCEKHERRDNTQPRKKEGEHKQHHAAAKRRKSTVGKKKVFIKQFINFFHSTLIVVSQSFG